MNNDTVRKCVAIAARHQEAVLGYVEPDVQALLDELVEAPAPVEDNPPPAKKSKKAA